MGKTKTQTSKKKTKKKKGLLKVRPAAQAGRPRVKKTLPGLVEVRGGRETMWVVSGVRIQMARVYSLNISKQSSAVRTYLDLLQQDPRTASTQLVAEIVQNVMDWWLGQLQLPMDRLEAYARAARLVRWRKDGSGVDLLHREKPVVALLIRNNHLEIHQYGQGMLDARACLPIGCTSKAREAGGTGGAHGMGLKQVFAVIAACRHAHPQWALCVEGTLPDGTYASLVPAVISEGEQETYGVRGIRRDRPKMRPGWEQWTSGTPTLVHRMRVWDDEAADPLQLLARAHVLLRAWPTSRGGEGAVLLHTEDVAALALGPCGKNGGALYLNGQFAGPSHIQPLDLLVHVPDPRTWSDINRSTLRREELERHVSEQCHEALEREVEARPACELRACDLSARDTCVPSEVLRTLCAARARRSHVVALLTMGRSLAVRKAVYLAWPQLADRTCAWLRTPRVSEWEVLQFEGSFGKDVWTSPLRIARPTIMAHTSEPVLKVASIPADLYEWLVASVWSAVDDDVHYLGETHHHLGACLDEHLLEHMRFPWQASPPAAQTLESGARALGLLLQCAPYDVRAWEGARYLEGGRGWHIFPKDRRVAVDPAAKLTLRATEMAWAGVFEHAARGTPFAALDFDTQVLPFVRHVVREQEAGRTLSHPVRLELRDFLPWEEEDQPSTTTT